MKCEFEPHFGQDFPDINKGTKVYANSLWENHTVVWKTCVRKSGTDRPDMTENFVC